MKENYGKSERNLRLWIDLSRIYLHLSRKILPVFQSHQLSPGQFAVLEALYHKGDLCVGEVKRVILTTGGNLTVVIQNLEKRKLIRICEGEDRRMKILSLTEEGSRLLEEVFPKHVEVLDKLLNVYTAQEKEILIQMLYQGRALMRQQEEER